MRLVSIWYALLIIGWIAPGATSLALSSASVTVRQQAINEEKQLPASKPNPDAAGIYHMGDGVIGPEVAYAPDPEFSDKARKKRLGGTCIVSLVVDADGNPHNVRVVQSIATGLNKKLQSAAISLDENAVKAAQQYRFKPATYQGKPVPFEVKIEVAFRFY